MMNLTPHEKDGLLVALAAEVARKRLKRGLKLNHAEVVALVSDFIVEGARDGRLVADLAEAATKVVAADQVMEGVAAMIPELSVEATFPNGIKLVTVRRPVGEATLSLVPGEIVTDEGDISMNVRRAVIEIEVTHTGDRELEIGSHYHFSEANPALRFDRRAASGKRLDIVPGTRVRFEPGESRTVRLIDIVGTREIFGFRGEVMGALDSSTETA